jgi:uncharacterized protein YecE (DUF72 family)
VGPGASHNGVVSQPSLFEPDGDAAAGPIGGAEIGAEVRALADRLARRWGGRLHLGTSSWHFPGWAGQVWDRAYPETLLSRAGLAAYGRHPLLRCVSLDRAFYRLIDELEYRRLAAQVPADFRFIVKAPAQLTDAQRRATGSAAPLGENPEFLDAALAAEAVARPAARGLGERLGALVLQLSPLPATWLQHPERLHERLEAALQAIRAPLAALAPSARLAVELRDPALLTPALAQLLRQGGTRYALGLHDRMPPPEEQLPMLRATWPGDLVCRWNLQRGQRYAQARDAWAPFDRLVAPDPAVRQVLARVMRATLDAGHAVFVTINNKAEGSAPASVMALAAALDAAT